MIRNISNSSGTSNTNSGNNQLKSSVPTEQARRMSNMMKGSGSNGNNSNRDVLLQQLRLITSQLSGSSANSMTSSPTQAQAPMQQRTQSPNDKQSISRPEVPQSNVGITTTPSVLNNSTVGSMSSNPIDVETTPSNPTTTNSSPPVSDSGSQSELFPYILHGMLDDVERIGQSSIVSWNADGKSFRIHDPDAFVSYILGKYLQKYMGGIASRLTQFRSDLKDWGFEDAVDRNGMGETFTHHCFQKGQANLCRYMRCGRKTSEPSRQPVMNNAPTNSALRPVQTQSQTTSVSNSSNVVTSTNGMTLGNAAQLILGQQLQQAKQQQQQQQQQALQIQALLSGVTNGKNPVATMSLIQLLMGQQQHNSPQAMPAAALQRQQQKVTVNGNSSVNSAPESSNGAAMSMHGGTSRTPATNTTVSPSNSSAIHTSVRKHPVRQWTRPAAVVPQVKRTGQTGSIPGKNNLTKTVPRPSPSAKRAAFLNKRSKATGAAYRNPNKKQKRAGASVSAAMVIKNRKKIEAAKFSSSLSLHKNGADSINAFTLNEDFKDKAISDLLFPWKLHDMLDDAELNQDIKSNVVSWQPDGVSFNIHDKDRFIEEVVPRYFEKIPKEWDVFLNVLSSWGFVRFTSGTQKGAFIHRLLVKGKRSVCKQMRINGKTVSDWMKQHGQFLGRLHALLSFAEKQGKRDIVSWTADGKKFIIHDPSAFMNSVFPMYFDSMMYSSFEQKLRRWGFMRSPANHQKIDKETRLENATYSHPQFVRGQLPNLVWIKSDTKIPRTLQQHNFLVRLRVMLSDASRHGYQFVVSWAPHGKAFMIHDRPYFSSKIMPSYFKSKFTSFRQSLRNHGFAQIGGNGWDEGAYYHKHFLRDEPQLCQGLTQDQMKKAMPEWIPVEDEPNFYPSDNVHESEVAAAASMVSMKGAVVNKTTSILPINNRM